MRKADGMRADDMRADDRADRMRLPVPRTSEGRAGLTALLAAPARALVALDFDGTLAPIVSDPADSRLVEGGLPVLVRLAATVGTVAVVTGRPAADVVALGNLDAVPGLVVAGQYGAERWRDGELTVPEPPPGIAAVRAELPDALAAAGADPGAWVEDKRLALVTHTRRAADPEAALDALVAPLDALARRHGLALHLGRYVLEIREPDTDKGGALRRLVQDTRPGAVLFAGDDRGDLPAFAAVEELRARGTPGLSVGIRSAEAPAVAERADIDVADPAGLIELLAAVADAAAAGARPG
jgi:trehalose 6-phosphate phosphatase